MATVENTRIIATLLKKMAAYHYNAILPIYSVTNSWNVNDVDALLPADIDVKTMLLAYNAIVKQDISIYVPYQDVLNTPGTGGGGTYAIPSTAFPKTFEFSGPLLAQEIGADVLGFNLTIMKVVMFLEDSGAAGQTEVDVKIDGVSCLTASKVFASGLGFNLVDVSVPLSTFTLGAASVLSAEIVQAATGARDLSVTVWLKSV